MMLLTDQILKDFKKQGYTGDKDPREIKIIVKFFNPCGGQTWYATEYNPEEKMFFGFVSLFNDYNDELGYFSLIELESLRLPFGLKIERDRHFGKHYLSEVLSGKRP